MSTATATPTSSSARRTTITARPTRAAPTSTTATPPAAWRFARSSAAPTTACPWRRAARSSAPPRRGWPRWPRTPFGRGDVALQWEVKPEGVAFNGSGLGQGPWTDSGTAGASLSQLISSLSFETRYHWRVRILGRPLKAASSSLVTYRSRWLYGCYVLHRAQRRAGGRRHRPDQPAEPGRLRQREARRAPLTNLTLRGYPQTAHPQASAYTGFGYGSQVLDRYFSVTPNGDAAGYSVGLCLNYDDAEVTGAGADESLLVLCRWAGTAWDCLPRGRLRPERQPGLHRRRDRVLRLGGGPGPGQPAARGRGERPIRRPRRRDGHFERSRGATTLMPAIP